MFRFFSTLFCTVLLLSGCSSTQLLQSYRAPDVNGKVSVVLIIGVTDSQAARRLFETEMAKQLSMAEKKAIPSIIVLKENKKYSKDEIIAIAHENNVDAVIVTKVLEIKEETEHRTEIQSDAGQFYTGSRRQSNWYNNYAGSYTTVSRRTDKYTIANLETSLYLLDKEELLWTALTKTVILENANDIKHLSATLVNQMKKDKAL